jgi:hypothetical protein
MWQQRGFALISDSEPKSPPLVHGYYQAEYEALAAKDQSEKFPEELRKNLRIVPAIFRLEA